MSIAMDEAEKKYPRDVALTSTSENNTCRRTGYIAGRAADVTDAEVKAAITEWDRHGHYSVCDQIVCMCGAKLTDRHGYRVHRVRAMLDAARKAVSE